MSNTILAKKNDFLLLDINKDYIKKINLTADNIIILSENKLLFQKNNEVFIKENNIINFFSKDINHIYKNKNNIILISNNIIKIYNENLNEIKKYIIPTKSIVLYCDQEFIIYNLDNKIFLSSNNETKILPFNTISLYLDQDIIYYYNFKSIFFFSINSFQIFKQIKIDIDNVKSIIFKDNYFFISNDCGLYILNKEGKIEKIFKNIEFLDFVNFNIDGKNLKNKLDLSLVLTCHEEYLKYLPNCIDSIEKQNVNLTEKILILDKCLNKNISFNNWNVYNVDFGHPNKSRNFGLNKCHSTWVMFFDADNIMPDNYLLSFDFNVNNNIAVIYKNILIINKDGSFKFPFCREWDYWFLRESNYIDTASIWRRDALINIGGWNEYIHNEDDYNLVLRLSKIGWSGKYLSNYPYVEHNSDHIGRWSSNKDKISESLFNSYSFTIVSLLSGREDIYEEWIEAIKNIQYPKYIDFCILDDSHNETFHKKLKEIYSFDYFNSVNIIKSPYKKEDISNLIDKHKIVANLYNYIIPTINTDFIITIEDDVIVPKNVIKGLFSMFYPRHFNLKEEKIFAGISGLYQSPSNKNLATLSTNMKEWKEMPLFNEMINVKKEVGFIGGGCALWLNSALKKCFPLQPEMRDNKLYGWDSDLCNKMRKFGYKIGFNGEVVCNHKTNNF